MDTFKALKHIGYTILYMDINEQTKLGLFMANYRLLKQLCHPHDHNQRRMMRNFKGKLRSYITGKKLHIPPKDKYNTL